MTRNEALNQAIRERANKSFGEDYDNFQDFLSANDDEDIKHLVRRAMKIYAEDKTTTISVD